MMKITIADYGVGNLHSISKGLEKAGARIEIVSDMDRLESARCIVFPGVGAFGAAMERLRPVARAVRESAEAGTPMLGVCLGMQIMFEKSEESPGPGLGLFRGDVRRLRARRVPQMGWNDVQFGSDRLFEGVPEDSKFYFANSYVCYPAEENVAVAVTDYDGEFASAVRKGGLCGVQFHPEKSGTPGLKVLANFVSIAEECR
ncbi:MAG: imidazole glycerol phosphate synthase subunit HisH [Thermoplasmata archaeon]